MNVKIKFERLGGSPDGEIIQEISIPETKTFFADDTIIVSDEISMSFHGSFRIDESCKLRAINYGENVIEVFYQMLI